MVQISQVQADILDLIRSNPGITYTRIHKITGYKRDTIGSVLRLLQRHELIRKEGSHKHYRYYATRKKYEVNKRTSPTISNIPDLLVKTLDVAITTEQRQYLEESVRNKIRRSQMAKALGISKVQLNHALYRLGLHTEEDADGDDNEIA